MPLLARFVFGSDPSTARRFEHAAFTLTMTLALLLGGAIFAITASDLGASERSLNRNAAQTLTARFNDDLTSQLRALHAITQNAALTAILSDQGPTSQTLRPFLSDLQLQETSHHEVLFNRSGLPVGGDLPTAENEDVRAAVADTVQ